MQDSEGTTAAVCCDCNDGYHKQTSGDTLTCTANNCHTGFTDTCPDGSTKKAGSTLGTTVADCCKCNDTNKTIEKDANGNYSCVTSTSSMTCKCVDSHEPDKTVGVAATGAACTEQGKNICSSCTEPNYILDSESQTCIKQTTCQQSVDAGSACASFPHYGWTEKPNLSALYVRDASNPQPAECCKCKPHFQDAECTTCKIGYKLSTTPPGDGSPSAECKAIQCKCDNGTLGDQTSCVREKQQNCASCDDDYVMQNPPLSYTDESGATRTVNQNKCVKKVESQPLTCSCPNGTALDETTIPKCSEINQGISGVQACHTCNTNDTVYVLQNPQTVNNKTFHQSCTECDTRKREYVDQATCKTCPNTNKFIEPRGSLPATCRPYQCTCDNGTAATGTACDKDEENCTSCHTNYYRDTKTCKKKQDCVAQGKAVQTPGTDVTDNVCRDKQCVRQQERGQGRGVCPGWYRTMYIV